MSAVVAVADEQPLLRAALLYASRGRAVVPLHTPVGDGCSCEEGPRCLHPGKHPRLNRWQKLASSDPVVIGDWWSRWPDANVGIVCGELSGVFVVDVDNRHGGDVSLEELEARIGPLTPTLTTLTGGGGLHYWFVQPPGVVFTNENTGRVLGPGLDVKTDGGLVVAPPSLHTSGRTYAWEVGAPLIPAAPPAALLALLTARSRNGAKATPPAPDEPIPAGRRRSALLSLAGAMRRQGADAATIAAALETFNAARCVPPLPATEVDDVARDVARRYAPAPSGAAVTVPEVSDGAPVTPPAESLAGAWGDAAAPHLSVVGASEPVERLPERGVPAFPLETLPAELAALATSASSAFGFPADYVAAPGLAVLACAIGGKYRLQVANGWEERPIVWVGTVGGPGSGKSPAMGIALRPLRDLQREADRAHAVAYADWAEAVSRAKKGDPRPTAEPQPLEYLVDDVTIEALIRTLAANPCGVLAAPDELRSIIVGLGQYKRGGGSDRSRFLSAWSGEDDLRYTRVGGGRIVASRPTLSVVGTIQPGMLATLGGADGLAARFLLAQPRVERAVVPPGDEQGIPDPVTTAWADLITTLARTRDEGTRELRLSADARKAWREARARHARWLVDYETRPLLGELAAKMDRHVARLALTLAVARSETTRVSSEVTEPDVTAAAALGEYFYRHAAASPVEEPNLTATPGEQRLDDAVDKLVSWLRDRPGRAASRREVHRACVGGVRTGAEVDRLLTRARESGRVSVAVDGNRHGPAGWRVSL
jgi:Protein of unknown function (DUF3987)/Bifunctional DNA primase/polymerase, N-terminal/Primase C terminal 1 (PriCT-1)